MAVRAGMVLTTALGGFALGANNMANVVGVFIDSNVFEPLKIGRMYTLSGIQVLFLLGAVAACVGVFTYSQKAIKTVGKTSCLSRRWSRGLSFCHSRWF